MPRGRPSKNGNQLKFRTVAVPLEVYELINEMAAFEERSIARQLSVLIKREFKKFTELYKI